MGRTPLLVPLTGLVAGILAVELLVGLPFWSVVIVLIIGVSGAFWRSGIFSYLLVFFALGWGAGYVNRPSELPVVGLHDFAAEVLETRETGGNAMIGIVTVDSIDGCGCVPFNVTAEIIGHRNIIYPGQRIGFHSPMEPIERVQSVEDVQAGSSAERRRQVVGFVMVLPDSLEFRGEADGVMPAMMRLNRDLAYRLSRADISDGTFALLSAMLLGDKTGIIEEERNAFSAAGISHLLALSGTHVAVLLGLISILMLPFAISRRKLPGQLLSILLLWVYAMLTGMSPSVVRAVIMASVFLFGRIIERTSVPLNSLCMAAMIILFVSPTELFMPGFQMSFAAVGGIIIFYPLLNRIDRRRHPFLYLLWSYPAMSLAAMSLTSLISAWYFHVFPLYFLLANMVAVPLLPLILGLGVVLLIAPHLDFVAVAADFFCGLLESVANGISKQPEALVGDIYLPLWLTLLTVTMLVTFGVSLHKRHLSAAIASVMLICASWSANYLMPPVFPETETFVVDGTAVTRNGNVVTVFADFRNEAERDYLYERFSRRLRHYSARRGAILQIQCPKNVDPD
ncbi:MAG: ComEC/Rec2 family competence protein [Muribaculaceae bacterium]|nr:ComEC/Rec2 family competence protein [Muribaculaceae bacterium]